MLDFTSVDGFGAQTAAPVAPIIIADDAVEAAQGLADVLGAADGVMVVSAQRLAADWPDYVVARARTSGGLVADDADGAARRKPSFTELAAGRLKGHPAVAGLVGAQLVFLLQDAAA